MRSRSAFLNAACASQILEKQAVKCGGAPVPAHSRHHQRLRGVGFKWNWRRCCIWFALLQMAINAHDASACASAFAARSAPPPHPRDAGFLFEPTPASSLLSVPRESVVPHVFTIGQKLRRLLVKNEEPSCFLRRGRIGTRCRSKGTRSESGTPRCAPVSWRSRR